MDVETQRRSLVAFYFGTKVATADATSDDTVRGAAWRAYKDLQRTLHGFGSHPKKEELREAAVASIQSFIEDLPDVDSQEEFDQKHDAWCTATCDRFKQNPHDSRDFTFHYGQAQKWLNMTLKYLAVLDHPGVQHVYDYLHVPVDQYVYNEAVGAGVRRPAAPSAWSRLSRDKYFDYQSRLREMVQSTGDYSGALNWEADVWINRENSRSR